MDKFLFSKVRDVKDESILQLLKELETVTRVRLETEAASQLFHYMSQCIYPNGASEAAVPITRDDLDENDPLDCFLLRKKIRTMTDLPVYALCTETAQHFGEGIERHEGKSLYLFINHFFSVLKKKKKNTAQRRFF